MKMLWIVIFVLITPNIMGQAKNVAERLGYSKNDKLLIIHADDLGVSHSENMASIQALEKGPVNSASIMVPCPWFPEIAKYASSHTDMDFGIHLTLTSEWKSYKWGSSLRSEVITSLLDDQGNFYASVQEVGINGTTEAVKKELITQIEKAINAGIDITHLDTHMGAVLAKPEFIEAYLSVGLQFKLPVLLTMAEGVVPKEFQKAFDLVNEQTVVVDNVIGASPNDFNENFNQFYTNVLNNLEPGLNVLLLHLAFDDEEMKAITVDHPNWGAKWRQADFDFFTSENCKELIKANNIKMVTWREIRDKITRS